MFPHCPLLCCTEGMTSCFCTSTIQLRCRMKFLDTCWSTFDPHDLRQLFSFRPSTLHRESPTPSLLETKIERTWLFSLCSQTQKTTHLIFNPPQPSKEYFLNPNTQYNTTPNPEIRQDHQTSRTPPQVNCCAVKVWSGR
jgi:hypothetical protein